MQVEAKMLTSWTRYEQKTNVPYHGFGLQISDPGAIDHPLFCRLGNHTEARTLNAQ